MWPARAGDDASAGEASEKRGGWKSAGSGRVASRGVIVGGDGVGDAEKRLSRIESGFFSLRSLSRMRSCRVIGWHAVGCRGRVLGESVAVAGGELREALPVRVARR